MERLNFHHLLYFWTVAREGSVASASAKLRLAQPTLSGQIHTLEDALGEKLFERAGRGLRLTDMGRVVSGYADEIFALGHELRQRVGHADGDLQWPARRSEEHTSELQSQFHLVCRLLLEKKKKKKINT